MNRRHFLSATLPAAAGLALVPGMVHRAKGASALSPPLAVFSKVYQELKLDFEQSAEVTAEAGLDGIDCTVRPGGEIGPEKAADLMPAYAQALRRHRVAMLLLTTAITGVSSPHAEDILRTGRLLGPRYYRLGYWSHRPDRSPAQLLPEIRSSLKDLAALNQAIGVCGVYQNHSAPNDHPHRNAGCELTELYEMVKDLDPNQIGVAFDLGHAIVEHGDQWPEHFERLKPHIRVVYIKDVRRPAEFVPFGQGEFSHTDFFQRLARMNYRAPLSLHIEFEWAAPGNKTRPLLVKTLQESRLAVNRWLAAAA